MLAHPFLTGRKAARMIGESAEFDVFISYRVQSDLEHAEMIYDKLTAAGLKVWWDKKSLAPGVPWQVFLILVQQLVYYYLQLQLTDTNINTRRDSVTV